MGPHENAWNKKAAAIQQKRLLTTIAEIALLACNDNALHHEVKQDACGRISISCRN